MTDDAPCRVFLISPIGAEGSEVRKRADQARKYLVRAALPSPQFQVDRADEDTNPGSITPRMIDAITSADLVVIDLTGHNPNVFYEMAIAHGYRKPCVHIITEGEAVPFDVKDMRVVSYVLTDPEKLEAAVQRLSASASSAMSEGTATPLTAASEFKQIESSTNPVVSALASVSDRLERLEVLLHRNGVTRVLDLWSRIDFKELGGGPVDVRPVVDSLLALDDEEFKGYLASFAALSAVTQSVSGQRRKKAEPEAPP